MEKEKQRKEVIIEPEIFDETGRKISAKHESAEESVKRELNPLRQAVMGVLGTIVAIVSGLMMFCVFLVVFIVMAIPVLILSLFGRKPNIKVFKYKI